MISVRATTLPATFAVLLTTTAFAASGWTVDPAHSAAQFSLRHMMVSTVRGEFQKVSGTVRLDEKDITRSTVDVRIEAASINTREPKRDEHLRSSDFFDVQKFPTITFTSRKIEKANDKLKIIGDLTMHGVTKAVVLESDGLSAPRKNPWGQLVRGATATGAINRKDFGLTWNKALETGGMVLGDEVKLQIDVELNPAPPEKSAGTM